MKCPWMVHLAPTATLEPQVLANSNDEAFAPVTAMLMIGKGAVPVLVRVTDCDALSVPTRRVPYERLLAERDTAGNSPVPVSAIDCGEFAALSVMVTAADTAPVAVGAKCPWMVQLAPTATLDPQVLANANDEALVPVTAMLMIVNGAVPVLVRVTDFDALSVPTNCVPYERLVAERDTTGVDMPVPFSAIDCGELLALSVMVMVADSAPVSVGVKCPWMVQLAPAARVEPQVSANRNDEAFGPVTVMPMIGTDDAPLLVRVTDCDALAVPTCWVPYERLVADREKVEAGGLRARVTISGIAIPVPVSHCP